MIQTLFFRNPNTGELVIKQTHPYLFQMQLEMFVVGASSAFLVIYTLKDFWNTKKLKTVYVPSLLEQFSTQQ